MSLAPQKPFSQACENNRGPILDVLQAFLKAPGALLEIGSGTGQHAAWIAPRLAHIQWQPSDLPDNLPGIAAWLDGLPATNVRAPVVLDVSGRWPEGHWHYLFTANTFHIMAPEKVQQCIATGAAHLAENGLFCVYGPFRIDGQFTSHSNAEFDSWLRQRDPRQGIRDLEWVDDTMRAAGLEQAYLASMPANNLMLIYRKTAPDKE